MYLKKLMESDGETQRIQKNLIAIDFLIVKTRTPYEILLARTSLKHIELEVLRKVILYRQRITGVDSNWISVEINQEVLKWRKNTWNLQFKMWFKK